MKKLFLLIIVTLVGCGGNEHASKWLCLEEAQLVGGAHHYKHAELLNEHAPDFNKFVLKGIDIVQKSAPEGGGYFIGIKADPPESPIGYNLCIAESELVNLKRKSSYCSGASYSAFIEALNLCYGDKLKTLSADRVESLRMQEPDGGRRNDNIKFWGKWNDDGYGNHFSLVQYSGMAEVIKPEDARAGDFMNISWKNGGGHSVIFLGWVKAEDGSKKLAYWSSQKGTNGLGDQVVSLDRINEVMVVRVTNPDNLFTFDPQKETERKIKGYKINWET